jgi:hypothetical protein
MQSIRRFLQLARPDRSLLARATIMSVAFRLALWFLPFDRIRRSVVRPSSPDRPAATDTVAERVRWAVEAAARRVPGSTCLTSALVACSLLDRAGSAASLRVGVLRDGERLRAHAWVVSGTTTVVGGEEAERYTPLAVFDGIP